MASLEWQNLDPELKGIIEAHQSEAPIKLSGIGKALGLTVKASTLPAGIAGEIRPNNGSYSIRVNRHEPKYRQRFTVAHEISHFLLHSRYIGDGITDDVLYRSNISDSREAQANRLAADILMPQPLIDKWLTHANALGVEDIVEFLANKFLVSQASMKIRLGLM